MMRGSSYRFWRAGGLSSGLTCIVAALAIGSGPTPNGHGVRGALTGRSVLRTVHVGQQPVALAVNTRTRQVFVVNQGPLYPNGSGTATGRGSVTLLDAATGRLVRTMPVGEEG
jgi:DNA-binding beta-propeller fold protein YncE